MFWLSVGQCSVYLPLSIVGWLNGVADLTDTNMDKNAIIVSLNSEPTSKLINIYFRIPRLILLIPSLHGWVSRTHVESLGKPHDSTIVLETLPQKTLA